MIIDTLKIVLLEKHSIIILSVFAIVSVLPLTMFEIWKYYKGG